MEFAIISIFGLMAYLIIDSRILQNLYDIKRRINNKHKIIRPSMPIDDLNIDTYERFYRDPRVIGKHKEKPKPPNKPPSKW